MISNFFKIALRYLWRNKTYSVLNLLCLTFGLTCTILAVLQIRYMVNHDKFHANYERLYAVDAYVTHFNGSRFPKEQLSASLVPVLKEHAPEIEEATRIVNDRHLFTYGDKSFTEKGVYADANLFNLFSFSIIHGNQQSALSDANNILISERMARKFFGNKDCLGQTLTFKHNKKQEALKITGILKDIPLNSAIAFDYIIPLSKYLTDNPWANDAGTSVAEVWVLLKPAASPDVVNQKIKNLIKNQEATLNQELFLFPLKEKNLYSYADGKRVWRDMQYIVMGGIIGFAILLIACFNFINLAIALNMKRHREVGIKKVTGSRKTGIIFQFLGETFIITLLSLCLAFFLAREIASVFSAFFSGTVSVRLSDISVILIFTAIALFTGLVSGLFPSLYLASSNPVNVLKGKISKQHSYSAFRQGLIVFQFVIPIVLIIFVLIIKAQDKFIDNFNVGVDRDKLVVLDNTENIQKQAENVKTDLLAIPGVTAVSYTNCLPTRGTKVSSEINWEGKDASAKQPFWCINTDFDYNKTLDIMIISGRFFDPQFPTDSSNFVINDVAAKMMKYKDPLGRTLSVEGKKGLIVGVFTNFHAVNLAGPVVPTIIQINKENRNSLIIKYASASFTNVSKQIAKVYTHYETEVPYRPTVFRDFVDYSNLGAFSIQIGVASVIAILIACLGLFGLASFTAASRTKEIGIRKANGARTQTIMTLLLSKYAKWLTISLFIALPVALGLGVFFLGQYFFHTPMPVWAFVAGPVIVYLVALITVGRQAYKVASQNPVVSLRYE